MKVIIIRVLKTVILIQARTRLRYYNTTGTVKTVIDFPTLESIMDTAVIVTASALSFFLKVYSLCEQRKKVESYEYEVIKEVRKEDNAKTLVKKVAKKTTKRRRKGSYLIKSP